MSDAGFHNQISATLTWEGGYADDLDDPGGETNFGISKRSYPSEDIEHLTKADAIVIYKRDYWDRPGLARLPDMVGGKVFDLGVNMGQRTAIKLLQRALNHAGWRPPLAIDGALGTNTLHAVGTIQVAQLLPLLRQEAKNHYIEIATAHPVMRKYLNGWLRRAGA